MLKEFYCWSEDKSTPRSFIRFKATSLAQLSALLQTKKLNKLKNYVLPGVRFELPEESERCQSAQIKGNVNFLCPIHRFTLKLLNQVYLEFLGTFSDWKRVPPGSLKGTGP